MGHAHLFGDFPTDTAPTYYKSSSMEYLSHHLRALRAAQGKTQQYVASLINKNQSAYSRIESGTDQLNIEELVIIAKDFGITPHQLLEMAQSPPYPQKK